MNTVVVIQARLNSSRLPRKALLPIGGYPAIVHTILRAKEAGYRTILAVPSTDHQLIEVGMNHCEVIAPLTLESDVLARFAVIGEKTKADIVVRLTGDCPFVQPNLIQEAVGRIVAGSAYASNVYVAGPDPDQRFSHIPRGMDVEAFTGAALQATYDMAQGRYDREHVTSWMRRFLRVRALFSPGLALSDDQLVGVRWCLDTPQDYAWMQKLAAAVDVTPPHNPTVAKLIAFTSICGTPPETSAATRRRESQP